MAFLISGQRYYAWIGRRETRCYLGSNANAARLSLKGAAAADLAGLIANAPSAIAVDFIIEAAIAKAGQKAWGIGPVVEPLP
jgi:hypothetical protein